MQEQAKTISNLFQTCVVNGVNDKAAELQTCCVSNRPFGFTNLMGICGLHGLCNEGPKFMTYVEASAVELSNDCNRWLEMTFFGKVSNKSKQSAAALVLHLDTLNLDVPLKQLHLICKEKLGRRSTYVRSLDLR